MNALAEKYGDKVAILGYPCNQFGHQTNEDNAEFLNTLKYVRPGGNFEPAPTITIMEKGDVNGENAQPVWEWLRTELPLPCDEPIDTKSNGVNNRDALVLPRGKFGGSTVVLWTPVSRTDVAWNFEKFLVDADGKPVKRYGRYYPDVRRSPRTSTRCSRAARRAGGGPPPAPPARRPRAHLLRGATMGARRAAATRRSGAAAARARPPRPPTGERRPVPLKPRHGAGAGPTVRSAAGTPWERCAERAGWRADDAGGRQPAADCGYWGTVESRESVRPVL